MSSKALNPVDATERAHLYKMNFLDIAQLAANLSIFLDCSDTSRPEAVKFLNEEEIYELLTSSSTNSNEETNHYEIGTTVVAEWIRQRTRDPGGLDST